MSRACLKSPVVGFFLRLPIHNAENMLLKRDDDDPKDCEFGVAAVVVAVVAAEVLHTGAV
ncbi:MAG: hypothetical protein L0K93_08745 [Lactococcus sp.]|nr:hypothetical protein [Lactococcus sp.]